MGVSQHQPWPPPDLLRFVICDAGLRPLPWPSFSSVERSSVRCYCGCLWKPPWSSFTAVIHELDISKCYSLLRKHPWPPPAHQYFRTVHAEIVESGRRNDHVRLQHKFSPQGVVYTSTWDFSLPHMTYWYASAHLHMLSAFVSLLASPKSCDQSKLLVLPVSKLSNFSTSLHKFPAYIHASAAVLVQRKCGGNCQRFLLEGGQLKDISENYECLVPAGVQLQFAIKQVGVQLHSIQLLLLHCYASVLTLGLGPSESRVRLRFVHDDEYWDLLHGLYYDFPDLMALVVQRHYGLHCSAWVQSSGLKLLHFCLAADELPSVWWNSGEDCEVLIQLKARAAGHSHQDGLSLSVALLCLSPPQVLLSCILSGIFLVKASFVENVTAMVWRIISSLATQRHFMILLPESSHPLECMRKASVNLSCGAMSMTVLLLLMLRWKPKNIQVFSVHGMSAAMVCCTLEEPDESIAVYNISSLGASRISRRGECQYTCMEGLPYRASLSGLIEAVLKRETFSRR